MNKKLKNIKKVLFILIIINTIILIQNRYSEIFNVKSLINSKSTYRYKSATEIKSESETTTEFTLYKQDGETFEPIEGTKFEITDLDGKNQQVLTTDKNGIIKAKLPQGIYKAIEISANEAYKLEEKEEDRTYYFKIGLPELDMSEWIKGINGYSWDYIKSTIINNTGEVIAVGSISEYSVEIAKDFYDGIDLNSDGIVDEKSVGKNDGIIISYDEKGNYSWSKTFGGIDDDSCNEIIQTQDGGYVIVGYTSSSVIYLDEKIIEDLSKSNYDMLNKDGFILKIDQNGNYEWSTRIGGNLDEEIVKVIETSSGDVDIIGNFESNTLNFYENNSEHNILEKIQNEREKNSFIASYSQIGKYNWSKKIVGKDYIEICDITQVENSIAVAINYKGNIKIDDNNKISSYLEDYEDGVIINYSLKGELQWYYELCSAAKNIFSNSKFLRTTALATTKENTLVISIACSDMVKGRKSGETDYTTIYTSPNNGITSNLMILSKNGDFIKNLYDLNSKIGSSSANNATMMFTDIVATKDNGILIGGYYYSSQNIDVDKDGISTGDKDFRASIEISSNGFCIKLDQNGNIKFSDCMHRSDAAYYTPSNVTCVNEINGEKIVFGGSFFGETASTKKFYSKYENEEKYHINMVGNTDGFIVIENVKDDDSEVIATQNITVNNFKKKYTITTEVKNHIETDEEGNQIEVKGGKISGEYNQVIDGVEYKEEGIHYMETTKHGENSTKEITITPDEGYKIEKVLINGDEYDGDLINNAESTNLPIFTNVTNNIHVEVTFCKKITDFYKLPITGSLEILILECIGIVLICIGILKIRKK